MKLVISDTHFGHPAIQGPDGFIKARKHFTSVEDMNETIITNWNAAVTQHDTVIHAGDIAMYMKPKEVFELLKQLNGNLELIGGNHDSLSKLYRYLRNNNYMYNGKPKFTFHEVGIRIKHNKKVYYVTHYPMGLGEQRKTVRNLCGHIHESAARESNVLNIGVDSPELPLGTPFGAPIAFETAVELVESKWSKSAQGLKMEGQGL